MQRNSCFIQEKRADIMYKWKLSGLIATLIIALSLPLYVFRKETEKPPTAVEQTAIFTGSESCAKCHKKEYQEWQQSHHAKAMAIASEETVLGDFDNAVFEKDGVTSRFYKKDGAYFVHTRGPAGEMADYRISHTFGYYPLQQYLVPFDNGRLQCLPIAWDVKKKQWFHLYPDLQLDPEEWIYWTNQGQNWNSMCADCHSTNLKKNYDPVTERYDTTWAEISVGCEACHGAGSKHLLWADLPEMARIGKVNGLLVQTAGSTNQQQVELCAPCHSRRSMLGDYVHVQQDLLDTETPRLLDGGLYYPDGQIRDEVYVYGSFLQSKMYANDVRCADCHNVHTIKLHQDGNALCLQCHQAAVYDTVAHHFHKQKGEEGEPIRSTKGDILFAVGSGAECVGCHMPGRIYMGNDNRPDHSIRIPRPDLSDALETPNGCNRCHSDKSNEWSAEYTRKWYGSKQKFHFGTTFYEARQGNPQALQKLLHIVDDRLFPVLVRATALSLLSRYQSVDVSAAFHQALIDEAPLIRRTGATFFPGYLQEERADVLSPLLIDPVKAVRIEAARALAIILPDKLESKWRKAFDRALTEYEQTALYSADFAQSRLNLGVLYSYKGDLQAAVEHFEKSAVIDRDFYMARTNLAVLYSREGKNDLAEEQLREALKSNPDLADVRYSLGLLLSEKKQYEESVKHLQKAAVGMVNNSRAYYNLGQLLDFLRRYKEAEIALKKTVELAPQNMTYLQNLASFYVKRRQLSQAKDIAEQILKNDPASSFGLQVIQFIATSQREER